MPTELMKAFAHSRQPDADILDLGRFSACLPTRKDLGGYSPAIVLDHQNDFRVRSGRRIRTQADTNPGSRRMAVNIAQTFLRDAKQCGLDVERHAADVRRNIKIDGNFCPLGKPLAE